MRTAIAIAIIALLALAAPAASAREARFTIPERHYFITPVEMLDVYGTYRLSDGDVMRISHEQRRYWADFRQRGRVEIVPVDAIVFHARDGSMRLAFTPRPFATDATLTIAQERGFAVLSGRADTLALH
jgi:hypothetical protein